MTTTNFGQPKDGITSSTPETILFGSGTIHRGLVFGYYLLTSKPADWDTNYTNYYTRTGTEGSYTYTAVTGSTAPSWADDTYYGQGWNFAESLLCATGDGNKLTITPEITTVEVDGAWVKVAGLEVKTGEEATMEITPVEITPDIIKLGLIAEQATSSGATGFTRLDSKERIETGDYIDNLGYVGTRLDGTPIIIIFEMALCTSGMEIEGKNKDASKPSLTFECVAKIEANHRILPYHIYYPTPSTL